MTVEVTVADRIIVDVIPYDAVAEANIVAAIAAHNADLAAHPGLSSGDGAIRVPFNWGDATPKTIVTLPANTTVFTAQIVIQTPFNGTGATLRLGDSGNLNRLMTTAQNDPTSALTFTSAPAYTYTSSTSILLSIVPGSGANTGSGFVLLTI